jgi:Lon protease-like protein
MTTTHITARKSVERSMSEYYKSSARTYEAMAELADDLYYAELAKVEWNKARLAELEELESMGKLKLVRG